MSVIKMGARLRELRELKEKSQRDVERELKIAQKSISDYENERSIPPVHILAELSKYYKVSIDYLIFGDYKKFDESKLKYEEMLEYVYALNELSVEEIKLVKMFLDRVIYVSKERERFRDFLKK